MRVIAKNLQKRVRINLDKIEKIAHQINSPYRFSNLKLVIYFIRNNLIKKINQQFFHKDRLTDVVSFLLDKDYAEVFIAPSVVKSNAKIYKVEFKEELYRCVVHGILHIFGYTDNTKTQKLKMWKRQEGFIKELIK